MRGFGFIVCGLLGVSLLLAGCNGSDEEYGEVSKNNAEVPQAGHAHEHGPHDGHVVELDANDLHAEIVLDTEARTATVFILDADMQPYPLEEGAMVELHLMDGEKEAELSGVATPLEGEADGKASRFQFASGLPASLENIEDAQGHVHVTAGNKTMNGEITHEAHDHDHDDHDHDGEAGN